MKQEPLWQQTVTKLKRGILASENCAGARFPSLTDLSREYGISKISALRAVSELEQAGLVKRIPRRGTFIIGRSRPRAIRVLLDFKQGWPANILPIIWEYMRGVEAQCKKNHAAMQVVSLEYIAENPNADDLYILLATDPDSPNYRKFSEKGCHHVFLHSSSRLMKHDCIRANHRSGGRIMTGCMLDAGHRRIAYIGGAPLSSWHAPRIRGYMDALEENNLPLDMKLIGEVPIPNSRSQEGIGEVDRLLSLPEPPTAIVASDDMRALSIIGYLEQKGLSVPGDMAVSGMDARIEALERKRPLTTCDWQLQKQGEMAVDLLLYPPATKKEAKQFLVEPKLVRGETI